jgi:monoterpene epsilon-lactone hydrolase
MRLRRASALLVLCTLISGIVTADEMAARDRIRASFPPPTLPTASVEQQRREWERFAAGTPMPKGVTWRRIDAGAQGELVSPRDAQPRRLIVWIHGGGFISGSPLTHRALAARIAVASRSEVLLVDYRLAPEHAFPAARDDVVAAYHWALAQTGAGSRLVVGGDSAGAHVAMTALLALRDQQIALPAGIVLLSPWLDLAQRGVTMNTRRAVDPQVLEEDLAQSAAKYLGSADPLAPEVDVLAANLRGLPAFLVQVGDQEVLLSDATRFAAGLELAHVPVTLEIEPEVWHVFHAWAPELPEANAAIGRIGRFIEKLVR